MKISKISIVIPAFNEESTIEELIDRVENANFGAIKKEIIIVNDGSTDNTSEILKKYTGKHIIVTHELNRGKGAAVRTGFDNATGDFAIVQDADLEYDPGEIPSLIEAAEKNDASVVFGSRNLGKKKNKKAGWNYYFGGVLLSRLANLLFGLNITDEPTCYKMVKVGLIRELNLEADGFEICPEITSKIGKRRIPILEVPISYHPRSVKQGKKIKYRDGLIAIWILIKNRL